MLAFSAGVLFSIRSARTNPNIFLRRIPGIDAVEEAVGRATEMGRPVLYLTGSGEFRFDGDLLLSRENEIDFAPGQGS